MKYLLLHTVLKAVNVGVYQGDKSINAEVEMGPLHEPNAVLFSFDTLGWKVVFMLLFCLLLWRAGVLLWRFNKNAYRRSALKKLVLLEAQFVAPQNREFVNATNILLKQMAIAVYGRAEVANLIGKDWVNFLDSKSTATNFRDLGKLFYRASLTQEEVLNEHRDTLLIQTKKWIETHA